MENSNNVKINQTELLSMINEILKLTLSINLKTKYCAFAHISGHVSSIDITVSLNKQDYNDKELRECIYYEGRFLDKAEMNRIISIRDRLKVFLKEGQLDGSDKADKKNRTNKNERN